MLDKTLALLETIGVEERGRIDFYNLIAEAKEEVKFLRSMPEIVMLAGSARFKQAFEACAYRLVLEGNIVLGKHVFKPGSEWPLEDHDKDRIHAIQFRMVDLASRVHIVNVDGYVGNDTYNLIRYAIRKERTVTFMEPNVRLLEGRHQTSAVTSNHFMQATRQRVDFEQTATG